MTSRRRVVPPRAHWVARGCNSCFQGTCLDSYRTLDSPLREEASAAQALAVLMAEVEDLEHLLRGQQIQHSNAVRDLEREALALDERIAAEEALMQTAERGRNLNPLEMLVPEPSAVCRP